MEQQDGPSPCLRTFDFTSEKVNCKAKASLEGIPVEVVLSNLGSHSSLENYIVFSSRKTSENRKRSGTIQRDNTQAQQKGPKTKVKEKRAF